MDKLIKIGLALLLFLCLTKMPYGYYQMVRFLSFVGFGLLAYLSYKEEQMTEAVVLVVLSLLFQPFSKVDLGRTLWNIVDVIVGMGLIISLFRNKK